MKEIQVHPFDLTYDQINNHKKLYKGLSSNQSAAVANAKSSLDQVFVHLSKHLQLHPGVWRGILAHLDQSTSDINFSQEDFNSKFNSIKDQKQFRAFDENEQWNVGKKQDLVLMSSRIEFSDFLRALQRESVLRDILAEHQMYFHSTKRLTYKLETKLITKQALEAMALARLQGNQNKASIPTVTYLIDNLLMFNYQGVQLCLICFENQSVQVFESGNGHFTYEFSFYDNVFEHIKGSTSQLSDKEKEQREKELDLEYRKSGMTRIEFNLMRRKAAREKGEYVPEPPVLSKPVRTHFHELDAAQKEKSKLQSAERRKHKLKSGSAIDDFLAGFYDGLDPKLRPPKKQTVIVEAEEQSAESRGGERLGEASEPDVLGFALVGASKGGSPDHSIPRWEKAMNQHTEASFRDSQDKFRACCSSQAAAFMRANKNFLFTSVTQQELQQAQQSYGLGGRAMVRGKSAGQHGLSRQGINQAKALDKNFGNLSSTAAFGNELTTAAGTSALHNRESKSNLQPKTLLQVESERLQTHASEQTHASHAPPGGSPRAGGKSKSRAQPHTGAKKQALLAGTLRVGLLGKLNEKMREQASLRLEANVRKSKAQEDKRTKEILAAQSEHLRQRELEAQLREVMAQRSQNTLSPRSRSVSQRGERHQTLDGSSPYKTLASGLNKNASKLTLESQFKQGLITRGEYQDQSKVKRQAQSQQTRSKVRAWKTLAQQHGRSGFQGILGIESAVGKGETAQRNDRTRGGGQRAYGLSDALFIGEQEAADADKEYRAQLENVDLEIRQEERALKERKELRIAQGKPQLPTVYRPPAERTAEETTKTALEIEKKQNALHNHIQELKEKSDVFCGWLEQMDREQRAGIRKDKFHREQEIATESRKAGRTIGLRETQGDESQQQKAPHLVQLRQKLERDRKKAEGSDFSKRLQDGDTGKAKKNKNKKQTYPVCMEYYEPHNIAIFGLVSKEIQIHQLKQTGVRRSFFHCQSMRVEHMIVSMTIEQHKGTSNLIVCCGTQSKKKDRSEVAVWILDPKLEFEVLQSYRWTWPYVTGELDDKIEQQITQVYYKSGCGLIICSFTGFIEIYDAINVNHSVWDNGRLRITKSGGGSISTVCYSASLDLIAYAGVSGKIYILDQTTKNPNGHIQAHKCEVIMLKFYDPQHQLISVGQNGEVGLWDAQKLTKIQLVRNAANMSQKIISACSFYEPLGRILMATTKIYNFDLEVDNAVKIKTDQFNAIARDYLRQFRKQLADAGIAQVADSPPPKQQGSGNVVFLTEEEYVSGAYKDESLKNRLPCGKEYNSSVVASSSSRLVGLIMDKVNFQLYTVDSDLLIRVWNCSNNECVRSYHIETREDQLREANQHEDEGDAQQTERKKAQLVRADQDIKFLLVAFEAGEVQVNNLQTGALIYNNSNVKPIKIEHEITQLKFFNSQTKFWVAASCWEGRVAFISRPQVSQGRNFLMFKKCRCSHQRDVIALDINSENQLVTASLDNTLCFWNSFNGVESKMVELPAELASLEKGQCIQHVKFPFPHKKDILLIVINNGDCFVLETQTEKFMQFHANAYQDGCDQDETESLRSDLNELTGFDSQRRAGSANRSHRDLPSGRQSPSQEAGKHRSKRATAKKPKETEAHTNKSYHNHLLGRIASYSALDIQQGYMVSISENGRGVLNTIGFAKQSAHVNLQALHPISDLQKNPIQFEEIRKFKLQEEPIDSMNGVFLVQIVPEYDLFITGQIRGNVNIMSLNTCEVLGTFNKGIVNLPKELTEEPEEDTMASSFMYLIQDRETKQQRAQRIAREIRDYKTFKTKKADWDDRLMNSKHMLKDKFQSDILQSIWKQHHIPFKVENEQSFFSQQQQKNKDTFDYQSNGENFTDLINVDFLDSQMESKQTLKPIKAKTKSGKLTIH